MFVSKMNFKVWCTFVLKQGTEHYLYMPKNTMDPKNAYRLTFQRFFTHLPFAK